MVFVIVYIIVQRYEIIIQNSKFTSAIKQGQSQACLNYAEREQLKVGVSFAEIKLGRLKGTSGY